jgi:hypothetical protein
MKATLLEHFLKQRRVKTFKNKNNSIFNNFLTVRDKKSMHKI